MEFRNVQNLLGAILRTGEPVIVNDPTHAAFQARLPEGHPPLRSFLGVPIREGEHVLGILGLANRAGGYDRAKSIFFRAYGHLCGHPRRGAPEGGSAACHR